MQQSFALKCLRFCIVGFVGCGEAQPSVAAGGSVEQGLQLPSGASVSVATYAISGPNDFASAGTVPVGDTADVPVVVSHLPVGQGYELAVSATASDGLTVCEGSTTFDVTDGAATLSLIAHLECAVPSGELDFQAIVNICPVLDGLSASPSSLNLGGMSRLVVAAHDSDSGPAPIAYSWSLNGVKLPRQSAPTLSFSCSSLGEVTIAALVSDSDPNPSCADSSSIKVTCE
jgi:hypothetical protein